MNTDLLAERDGAGCVWCGREVWPVDRSIEHLCPSNRGGHKTPENCLLACHRCNSLRKSSSAVGFAARREREGLSPRWDLLRSALEELSVAERRQHREYGLNQLRHLPAQESADLSNPGAPS